MHEEAEPQMPVLDIVVDEDETESHRDAGIVDDTVGKQYPASVASIAFVDRPTSPEEFHLGLSGSKPKNCAQRLLEVSVLSTDTSSDPSSPTDAAISLFVAQSSERADAIRKSNQRVLRLPMGAVFRRDTGSEYSVLLRGAPDVLFLACTHYWSAREDAVVPLDSAGRSAFKATQDCFSRAGEQVVVLCERALMSDLSAGSDGFRGQAEDLRDLTVVGILGVV
jgi:sodium/potassium-transporting ATPase subunit alpha